MKTGVLPKPNPRLPKNIMDESRSLKTLSLSQIRERYSNDYILQHFSISHQDEQWLPNKFFCVITNHQPGTIYAAKKTRSRKYKIMTIGGELWISVTAYFGQAKISVPRGIHKVPRIRMFPKKRASYRPECNVFEVLEGIKG